MTTNRILQWTLGLCLLGAFSSQAADKIKTAKGDLIINPVKHGTVVFQWDGKTVFVDPVGGAAPFKKFGTPDVVLVTDIHGDHFNKDTLTAVVKEKTVVIAPEAVAALAPAVLKKSITTLANGKSVEKAGIKVEAVPMYNLTPTCLRFDNKGRGNGYVMTFGGERGHGGHSRDARAQENRRGICLHEPAVHNDPGAGGGCGAGVQAEDGLPEPLSGQ